MPLNAEDERQVTRVARSLSLALAMDSGRGDARGETEQLGEALNEQLHQIKNPLQALRTFGKLLQRKIALEEFPDERSQAVLSLATQMMEQGERVSDLLLPMDDLVDELALPPEPQLALSAKSTSSSRIGDFRVEMGFVPDVVRTVLSACQAMATERNIGFSLVGTQLDLPGVNLCPKALQEALANLVDNALKYVVLLPDGRANPHPRVRVTLSPNPPDAPGVSITVEDNGPGIPPTEREMVFRRGYRATNARVLRGTGIGLDVSCALVRRMGGTVRLLDRDEREESSLGGAAFRIALFRSRSSRE